MPAAEARPSTVFVESWKEFGHMTLSALLDIPEWYYSSTYPKEWDMQAGEPPTTCGQRSAHAVGNASGAPPSAERAWLFATFVDSGRFLPAGLAVPPTSVTPLMQYQRHACRKNLGDDVSGSKKLSKIREWFQPTLDRCQMSSKAGLLDCLEAGQRAPSYMERLRRINRLRTSIGSVSFVSSLYDSVHHQDPQLHIRGVCRASLGHIHCVVQKDHVICNHQPFATC